MPKDQKTSFFDEMVDYSKATEEKEKLKKDRPLTEIIKTHLSEEQIKQNLGDIQPEQIEDKVEEVLSAKDKQKLQDYDKLKKDWEKQSARLEQLEINQVDYNQIKQELAEWKSFFSNQEPDEVEDEIKSLTEKATTLQSQHNQICKELKNWENIFVDQKPKEVKEKLIQLEQELTTSDQEYEDNRKQIQKLTKELDEWQEKTEQQNQDYQQTQKKLKQWTEIWGEQNPQTLKKEWELLKKRPEIPITEKQWWDDYVRRKSLTESEETKKELEDYKNELQNQLQLTDLGGWKTELAKLKGENQGWENKIRLVLELEQDEPLPSDWHNQLIQKQQITSIQDLLGEKQRDLKKWTDQFPNKTPLEVEKEKQIAKKPEKLLAEWTSQFENKTAKEVEKEIKNKEAEITILKMQIEELGGTVGANPSEKLIESKLKEVIVAEDWNLGYLIQVLTKFKEWREMGTSEQRRAIMRYWVVINKNLEYLEQRSKKIMNKF
ncbi:hypothetical protein [endosymbiont GvMRE of Glomus versiforme]|uniref:hypothetical protein n=1 Tax=endosymbiont GvMRE of Glomus versiforme TaxID=2039283 RepID=UPI000EEAD38B|nr:hypothetical protein [endosymbiont GvMRE of Glomus versiforme]RHZ36609.1 hypothetical protein GvMRE_I2g89 [endosymbiont GvMRE of Glomus versiforme]